MRKVLTIFISCLLFAVGVLTFAACGPQKEGTVSVYAPDGAPALSLARLMHEGMQFGDSVSYHVVAATSIQTYVTGKNPQADLCVLPVNAAAKALGTGSVYQMLGVVTHGNIYFLSNKTDEQLDSDNLSSLVGKTVGSIQLKNVVGLTLRLVLDEKNIPYKIIEDVSQREDGVVNLLNIGDPATMINAESPYDYMVAAEPVVSAKSNAIASLNIVGNLQALYGEGGYPQAVLVAKKELIEKNSALIQSFTAALGANVLWLMSEETSSQTIVDAILQHLPEGSTGTFNAKNLSKTVIENCAIRFENAATCKEGVKAFLAKLSAVSGEDYSVSEAFFYTA